MTEAEKLLTIETMTEVHDSNVLSTYLSIAEQIIYELAFPFGNFPEEMPSQYDAVHVEIATYLINKRGAEGETVHLENGVSRHWDDGSLPPALVRRITPFASPLG